MFKLTKKDTKPATAIEQQTPVFRELIAVLNDTEKKSARTQNGFRIWNGASPRVGTATVPY